MTKVTANRIHIQSFDFGSYLLGSFMSAFLSRFGYPQMLTKPLKDREPLLEGLIKNKDIGLTSDPSKATTLCHLATNPFLDFLYQFK